MQEKNLFEYAVIRVVPRVEREEFLNVGVIVYCSSQRYLQTMFQLNEERLKAFADIDVAEVEERLLAFKQVCAGSKDGGPIGKLPLASRFRWLISARSTIVQTSPVHPGLCVNAQEILEKLFNKLVL